MSQIDWTKLNREGSTPGLLILMVAAGIGFGALNGVIELGVTLLLPETNVGGYLYTQAGSGGHFHQCYGCRSTRNTRNKWGQTE